MSRKSTRSSSEACGSCQACTNKKLFSTCDGSDDTVRLPCVSVRMKRLILEEPYYKLQNLASSRGDSACKQGIRPLKPVVPVSPVIPVRPVAPIRPA